MLQTLTARLSIAAAMLALGATAASGATRNFTINTADIVDLYSATFDAPLTPCPGSPTLECTFFGGTTPVARAIVITPTGSGSGTMNVTYNDVTGEITSVNNLLINLAPMSLVITPSGGGTTVVTVTPGNGLPVTANGDAAFVEAGDTVELTRDLNGLIAPNVGSTGAATADADQGGAVGQYPVFQHNDSPQQDVPDFGWFSDIVDSCVDNAPAANCVLIQFDALTLDGIRYRLEGTVGCRASGHSLVLKTQTGNNSIYRVNLTVTTTDADCDGDTLANGVDNCPDLTNLANQTDTDGDGRGNLCDNCRTLANNTGAAAQTDSNSDGFGNRCDGDLNNNGSTNAFDTPLYRAQLGQPSVAPVFNAADINANGSVNAFDTPLYRALLGAAPGPGAGP